MVISGTLHGAPSSFRTQKVLIAAQYSGSKVKLASDFSPGDSEKKSDFLSKSPFGKAPFFESDDGKVILWEADAISSFVGPSVAGSDVSKYEIQQWLGLAADEFLPHLSGWVYPSLSVVPFIKQSVEQSKAKVLLLLKTLDTYLLSRTYLVGERISLADISLSVNLLLAFQYVIEPATRNQFPNVTRWFDTLVHQPQFKAVLGDVQLCDKAAQFDANKLKEVQAALPAAAADAGSVRSIDNSELSRSACDSSVVSASPVDFAQDDFETVSKKKKKGKKDKAADKKEEKPKEQKPAKEKKPSAKEEEVNGEEELDASEEALSLEPKKKDPFDAFPKSSFNLEEFKRIYSNNETSVSIPYFWEHYDKANYSIWYCEYKYPKELTKVYMSCNLIAGMFQRLEKLRKNCFASLILFGDDNNSTISGVWVWRCHELAFTLSDDWQTDYESYEWRKLDSDSAETKTLVQEYFAWEGKFGGKKFNQGKIFK